MNVGLNKIAVFMLLVLIACQGSDTENGNLARKLDSVNHELEVTKLALMDSQQVKALLDSIDASRKVTNSNVGDEPDSQNSISRLNDLNEYVKGINLKMDQMEKSIKYVNTMAASILVLQADLEARTQKIAKLEAEAKKQKANEPNTSLVVQRKDSTLAAFIKTCQQDIVVLQKKMEEVHAQNAIATSNIYFKQAEALTAMADKIDTRAKRKLVKHEAMELYKISLSLGNKNAQEKISSLEREL